MGATSGKTGKLRDPVFVSMVLAMILAIGSSITLRMVARHAGPSAAQAAEVGDDMARESLPPLPRASTHPARP